MSSRSVCSVCGQHFSKLTPKSHIVSYCGESMHKQCVPEQQLSIEVEKIAVREGASKPPEFVPKDRKPLKFE